MSANRPRARRSRMCRSVSSYGAAGAAPTTSRPSSSREPCQLGRLHVGDCARMKAIRIHEDGGPEVLRYEDAPDPEPGPGEVLVRLRAASLNHLDLWIRKGLPSVPKPRILGADGAGIREDTGERGRDQPGDRARRRRSRSSASTWTGRTPSSSRCPEQNVYPLPEGSRSRRPRPSRSSSRPRTGCSSPRRGCARASGCCSGGSGAASPPPALAIAKALGARALVTSSSDEKLERASELGADATVNHATGDVRAAVKEATGGEGVDVVWSTSARRPGRRRSRSRGRRAGSRSAGRRAGRTRPLRSIGSGGSS